MVLNDTLHNAKAELHDAEAALDKALAAVRRNFMPTVGGNYLGVHWDVERDKTGDAGGGTVLSVLGRERIALWVVSIEGAGGCGAGGGGKGYMLPVEVSGLQSVFFCRGGS